MEVKLLDRLRRAIRTRHYSRRTEEAYTHWVRRFIVYHGIRHPIDMGEAEVSSFVSSLAARGVSASTQNQALSAVLFLYGAVLGRGLPWMETIVRAQRPIRLPVVLSRRRRSGCIINVASIGGQIAVSPQGAYAASKCAVEALSECLAQEAKPFNIRVAIVEPGIVDTPMAQRISGPQGASHYPQQNRMAAFYISVLKSPALPSLVADRVLEIAISGTWQLRHPVGPDAVPFLTWRKAMTDEEWVAWGSLDDDAWYARVKAEFGIDARPQA